MSARCDELGPAGALLRTAAVIGSELDIDLLATCWAAARWSCSTMPSGPSPGSSWPTPSGTLQFRHDLLREALAASATAGRAALLHRQGQPGSWPGGRTPTR